MTMNYVESILIPFHIFNLPLSVFV